MLTEFKSCDESFSSVIDQCKQLLMNLDHFSQFFEQANGNSTIAATSTKIQTKPGLGASKRQSVVGATASKITINMAKIRNKKSIKKVSKLRDFTSNSYSYLLVILFQCKVRMQRLERNPNPHDIEKLISLVLGGGQSEKSSQGSTANEGEVVRANSLKMMYSMLRDSDNLYPQM